jgi:uncharacterized protein (TIGR00369 family)
MTEKHDDFSMTTGVVRVEWREGLARVALDLEPRHLNRGGVLHGGVLLALLDEAGALSGVWCSVPGNRRTSVTVDLSCHFTAQSRTGRVVATGTLVSHGRSLYFARSEVVDEAGRVLAFGSSTHKWRRGSETLEGSPRLE